MKPIQGWDLIDEAGELKKLPAGIYGVVITGVKNVVEGEYLEITCDIVKGEYANYFKSQVEAGFNDGSKTLRSYKEKALPFFKAFITAIEKTNPGYSWDWDEQKLVGKKVIAVFGEEEFEAKDGTIKVATRVQEFRSLEAFQQGKLKVPELKKLATKSSSVSAEALQPTLELDDLPF